MEPKKHHFFSLNTALCTVQVRFLKKDCTRSWLPETRFTQDCWHEIVIRSPLEFPLTFMPGLPRILVKSPKRFPSRFFYVPDKIFWPRISPRSLPGFSSKFLPWISSKILGKILAGILDTRLLQDLVSFLTQILSRSCSRFCENLDCIKLD